MTAPDREALGWLAWRAALSSCSNIHETEPEARWVWDHATGPGDRERYCQTGEALFAAGRASRDEEVAALRAEIADAHEVLDLEGVGRHDATGAMSLAARIDTVETETSRSLTDACAELERLRADVEHLARERDEVAAERDSMAARLDMALTTNLRAVDTLKRITPEMANAYFQQRGWTTEPHSAIFSRWRSASSHYADVPRHLGWADYGQRMSECIQDGARAESRQPIAVYLDMLDAARGDGDPGVGA